MIIDYLPRLVYEHNYEGPTETGFPAVTETETHVVKYRIPWNAEIWFILPIIMDKLGHEIEIQ